MEVTSDAITPGDSIAFVAEGPRIAIHRLTTSLAPTFIEAVPLPDCQPLALLHHRQPGTPATDWLYIAGGTHGLWRLSLCSNLFSSYTSCGLSSYQPENLDRIDSEYPDFERKRCVDVAILPPSTASGGVYVVLALFAASNDPAESGHHGTELRAYPLSGTTVGPAVTLSPNPWFLDIQSGEKAAVGTALAIDPGDPDSVYVALGKGGIERVDLAAGTPFALQRTHLSINFCTPCVDYVRDLAILRTADNHAFLFGALNYGRVLEYELTAIANPQLQFHAVSCGLPERIAVTSLDGVHAVIAVGVERFHATVADSSAPYTANGYWSTPCLDYQHPDLDRPLGLTECGKLRAPNRMSSSPESWPAGCGFGGPGGSHGQNTCGRRTVVDHRASLAQAPAPQGPSRTQADRRSDLLERDSLHPAQWDPLGDAAIRDGLLGHDLLATALLLAIQRSVGAAA